MDEEGEEAEGEGEEERGREGSGTLTRMCIGMTKGLMASLMSSSVTAISV